jgi:integrase/recombinase XerD
MRRWDSLVERYTATLEARGLAQGTIEGRTRELVRFGAWLKRRRPRPNLETVDADLVIRYVRSRSRFHSRSSVCCVVTDLRAMGEFLVEDGLWRSNPLRWIRGPKIDQRRHLPRRIGREHLKAIWAAAESRPQEHARYQAVCILAILYGTGLRRREFEHLDLGDWDRDASVLKIDGHKTNHERHVPVGEGVWRCIEAYLPRRHNRLESTGHVGEQALLINNFGERMVGQGINMLLRRLSESAGVARVTAHQFRHSCGSDLIESGVTIPEVQRILGHASIQSTVRYIAIADPQRAAAMSKHPVNRFLGSEDGERKAS